MKNYSLPFIRINRFEVTRDRMDYWEDVKWASSTLSRPKSVKQLPFYFTLAIL